jgi:hypothetical protein
VSTDATVQAIEIALAELHQQRVQARQALGEIEGEIKRHQAALRALTGDSGAGRHIRSGTAVLAALATYDEPVTSGTLAQHPDLVHYSEPTLRSALSALHRSGKIVSVERTPKGHLWRVTP